MIGLAGAGKSTMLGTPRARPGKRPDTGVHGAALAGKAAEGLEASSGIPSAPWRPGRWLGQRAPSARDGRHPGDRRGRDGVLAPARAVRPNGRAIRCQAGAGGRSRAAAADRAGGGFRVLSERTGFLELEAIRRQRTAWQRQRAWPWARRETRAGLEAYRENGAIRFTADGASARERLVADYLGDRTARPEASRIALAHPGRRARAQRRDPRPAACGRRAERRGGFATGEAGG